MAFTCETLFLTIYRHRNGPWTKYIQICIMAYCVPAKMYCVCACGHVDVSVCTQNRNKFKG